MHFRLPIPLVRKAFNLLYGPLAPAYDFISSTFFLGQWRYWQKSVMPLSQGRILEIGSGTGVLMAEARARGLNWTGVEPSKDMLRRIQLRFEPTTVAPPVVRAAVQCLPFQAGTFDTVTATFPTEWSALPCGSPSTMSTSTTSQ